MAKFCPNCGKEVDENAAICLNCGVSIQNTNQSLTKEKKSNGMAIAGFILSFFFALLGLIFSIVGLSKSKETNSGKGLSIAGIIISSINMLLGLIIGLGLMSTIPTAFSAINEAMQQQHCPTAYSCKLNVDGTYDCKYIDSDGEIQDITCEAKYRYQ